MRAIFNKDKKEINKSLHIKKKINKKYYLNTRQVLQCGELHVVVLIEQNLELQNAYTQIRLVEFILIVPTDRSEFSPFLHDGVKEAKREKQPFEDLPLL